MPLDPGTRGVRRAETPAERARRRRRERAERLREQQLRDRVGRTPSPPQQPAERPVAQNRAERIRQEGAAERERASRGRDPLGRVGPEAASRAATMGMSPFGLGINLGRDIGHAGEAVGPALLNMARAVGSDLIDPEQLDPRNIGESRTYSDVVKPTAQQYAATYGPLFRGDVGQFRRNVYEHPFGLLLDALTLATGGGAAVGALARRGALGAGRVSLGLPGERIIHTASGQAVRVGRTSANPVTRGIQNATSGLGSLVIPERVPVVGESARAARVAAKQVRRREAVEVERYTKPFDNAIRKLNKQERIAVVLHGIGVKPSELLGFTHDRLMEAVTKIQALEAKPKLTKADKTELRRLHGEIKDHDRMMKLAESVDDDLYDSVPTTPKLAEAREAGRAMTEQGGDLLEVLPEVRAARPYLPARIVSGARFDKGEGTFTGGRSLEELQADLGDLVFTTIQGPSLRTGQKPLSRSGTRKIREPGLVKQNKGLRLLTSRWVPDPSAWRDSFVKSIAYAHAIQRGALAFQKFGRALNPDGTVDKGGYYVVTPAVNFRKGNVKIDRAAVERPALNEQAAKLLDDATSPDDIMAGIDDVVTRSPEKAAAWQAKYGDDSVRQITRHEYNQLFGEFRPVNTAVRRFIDKPTDFWRALTLNYRPAWFVNNIVGQNVLYALNYAGEGGLKGYARAIMNRDTPTELSFGLYRTEQNQAGVIGQATNAVSRMTQALGRANAAISDNAPRRAAYFTLADKERKLMNRMEGTNTTFNEFLTELKKSVDDPESNPRLKQLHDDLSDQVLRDLIDFNDLSNAERQYVRRVLPFYSWLKGITKATGRLAFHHPAKTSLMIYMAQGGEDKFRDWFGAGYEVLAYALGLHKRDTENGQVAQVITTQGLNPFQTINDNLKLLKGLVWDHEVGFGSENPANALGPVWSAIIEGLTGRDIYTNETLSAPGGAAGRAARTMLGGFPQVRTAQAAFSPKEPVSGNGKVRFTVPGAKWLGVPVEIWRYFGIPVSEKNLDRAAELAAEQERKRDSRRADVIDWLELGMSPEEIADMMTEGFDTPITVEEVRDIQLEWLEDQSK